MEGSGDKKMNDKTLKIKDDGTFVKYQKIVEIEGKVKPISTGGMISGFDLEKLLGDYVNSRILLKVFSVKDG